jgi:hypothetical protein
MQQTLVFHHIGVACESIDADVRAWSILGYIADGAPFIDLGQGIRGLFMVGAGPRIELLEPTVGSMTLEPWLKRRTKLYHCGYIVSDFDEAMLWLQSTGAALARDAAHSVYFGSRIAFLMMPNMALIEIIESPDRANVA